MKFWLLTKEYNLYDQCGEYFVAAFKNKPTAEQLRPHLDNYWKPEHVAQGGGRLDYEDRWFNLLEEELQ